MDNPGYIGLTRLRGLEDELRVVANNVANASTTAFRAEGVVFAEVLARANVDGEALAMASPRARVTDQSPGGLTATGGPLDLAIDGEGFFQVETPAGPRLTRAGAFTRSPDGVLATPQGWPVLDAGGAPIIPPPGEIAIASDGTISTDGQPVGQIGIWTAPADSLEREDGVTFRTDVEPQPALDAQVRQGFLEQSNVDPVSELARLIEVQRAYELGQSFLDTEDQRVRGAVQTLGRSS